MKLTKYFLTSLLILTAASSASAAALGGSSIIAAPQVATPGPFATPQLSLPGDIAMPTTPSSPSTGMPSIPNTNIGGVDLSGLNRGSQQTTQNIDYTTGETQQTQIGTETSEIGAEGLGTSASAPATDADNDRMTAADVNAYLDDILNQRVVGNTMGELFRVIPRYGVSFFRRPPSTYAPQDSSPVTQGYRIGVGDEMTLTLWGIPEEGNFRFDVNRDGMAAIPHIGMVRLAGYTIEEAERIISARLNQYYTGFQMNLSMGRLSSIMVYVTGNAARPGAYTVSSFSTLVNALIASGGPAANGTLRNIELKRGGRTVAVFDMYAMLLQGDKTQDVRLQAGDVIYIPPVGPLVAIAGEVRRPRVYELSGATRVKDLIYIAGGENARTFKGRVQYFRVFDSTYATAFEGALPDVEDMELKDGDIIRLYPVFNLATSVVITGPLVNPGVFAITPGQTKLSEVINRAGGLTTTASTRAEVTRTTPSEDGPVNQRFTVDLSLAMQGDPVHNLTLENMDQITVLVIPDWKPQMRVYILGEVRRPGNYSVFPGERLSDVIERAGGFTPKAFLRGAVFTRVSVAQAQRVSINQMADRMDRELLESVQNIVGTGNTGALTQEYNRRRQLINNLRQMDVIGRIVTKVDTPDNIRGTEWDYELQNGDALYIPTLPVTVNVLGAVYSSTTQLYRPEMSINGYINAAGGALRTAHKRLVYLIKSDGTTLRLTRSTAMLSSKQWKAPSGFSATVEPGDTIVVPMKYMDRSSIESFKDTIDIIYRVAVATGVVIRAVD